MEYNCIYCYQIRKGDKTAILISLIIVTIGALFSTNLALATDRSINNNLLTYSNFDYGIKIKYPSNWIYHENKSNINYLFNESNYDNPQNIVTFMPLDATNTHLTLPSSIRNQIASFHFLQLSQMRLDPINPLVEYPLSTTFILPSVKVQVISIHNLSLLDLYHQFIGNLTNNVNGYSPASDCSFIGESYYHSKFIDCSFPLKIIETGSTIVSDNDPAYKIVYSLAGLKTMVLFTVKDNKAYIIRYMADESNYSKYLPIIQSMVNSSEITITKPSETISPSINKTMTYSNPYYGIKLKYPSNWEVSDIPESSFLPLTTPIVTFVSPLENGSNLASITIGLDSPPSTSLDQYPIRALNNYNNNDNILNVRTKLNPTTILSPNKYVLFHQDDMKSPSLKSNPKSENVTDFFVKENNTVYDINFRISTNLADHSDYILAAQEMLNSFEIYNAKHVPIITDGKIEPREWENAIQVTADQAPVIPQVTLLNKTDFIPIIYNVSLYTKNDEKNLFLLAKVKGPQGFNGGIMITYLFDTGKIKDVIRLYKGFNYENNKGPFIDGFIHGNTNNFQIDNDSRIVTNDSAGISFSNGTEIFELRHPLCSENEHDICISIDTNVDFAFYINATEDSARWPPTSWPPSSHATYSPSNGIIWIIRPGAGLGDFLPAVEFIRQLFGGLSPEVCITQR